jgi:hypothetical protein
VKNLAADFPGAWIAEPAPDISASETSQPGIRLPELQDYDTCTPPAGGTDQTADLDLVTALLDEIDVRFDALGFSSGGDMVLQMMFTAPLSTRFEGWA